MQREAGESCRQDPRAIIFRRVVVLGTVSSLLLLMSFVSPVVSRDSLGYRVESSSGAEVKPWAPSVHDGPAFIAAGIGESTLGSELDRWTDPNPPLPRPSAR